MNPRNIWTRLWLVFTVGAVIMAFALSVSAQVQSETTTTPGQATHEV